MSTSCTWCSTSTGSGFSEHSSSRYMDIFGLRRIALFALGSSSFEFAFSLGGVGLSGVGCGLFGLLWVLSRYHDRFRNGVHRKTVQLFVVWFFFLHSGDSSAHFSGRQYCARRWSNSWSSHRCRNCLPGPPLTDYRGHWYDRPVWFLGLNFWAPEDQPLGEGGLRRRPMGLRRSPGKPQSGSRPLVHGCGDLSAKAGHLLVRSGHRISPPRESRRRESRLRESAST
jgi:hypothetical protein